MTTYTLRCDHPGCAAAFHLLSTQGRDLQVSATQFMQAAEACGWHTSPHAERLTGSQDRCPQHAPGRVFTAEGIATPTRALKTLWRGQEGAK